MNHDVSSQTATPPLDDENLLQEILLRLPPKLSPLPRACLICKRWRNIISEPQFLCRFHQHHRKPPLLGFFSKNINDLRTFYTPIPYSPDRIPTNRFYIPNPFDWEFMGCRHGLALGVSKYRHTAIIWDPLTSQQQHVNFPPGFHFRDDQYDFTMGVAVLRLSAFKLVLAFHDTELKKICVCTYKSESGAWRDFISMTTTKFIYMGRPSILVGNALCWLLAGGNILQFDLERQTLVVIEKPADAHVAHPNETCPFQILRGSNGLGFAVLSGSEQSVSEQSIQLWARNSSCDGFVSWVLQRTIKLDELFSLSLLDKKPILIPGYDEDTNVIFLSSQSYDFMLQLDSMQFRGIGRRKLKIPQTYYPYAYCFTAVTPCEDEVGLGSSKSDLYSLACSWVHRMKKQVSHMITSIGS